MNPIIAINIKSILLFLVLLYGLAYNFTRFLKPHELDTHIIRLGIGLGAFPVVGVLLNILHIPLDWKIFLILALALCVFDLIRGHVHVRARIPKPTHQTIFLFIIFSLCLIIYCNGPFAYPWLEDDDSWAHAAGIKYISVEKNIHVPSGEFHYINPYPPGYDLILGVIHQTHPSIYWVLKFFNGFIISLGFLFFYIFAKEFTNCKNKALWSTFFLAIIPCYLSHFIWAHSLVVTLFFPALYCFLKAQDDKRFILPSSIIIAGIFLTQPTQSIKFCILIFLFIMAASIVNKRINKNSFIIISLAVLFSLMWWAPILKGTSEGSSHMVIREDAEISKKTVNTLTLSRKVFSAQGGTATRSYTLQDYLFPPEYNLVNNPIGVGFILSFLAFSGILFSLYGIAKTKAKIFHITSLLWIIFTFLGMNSQTFNLPIGLFAFRFWMLFAIPVSLLAAETTHSIIKFLKRPIIRTIFSVLLVISVLCSSGYFKYQTNTSIWPWGIYWNSYPELIGYVWMRKNLKPNTKVFSFKDNQFVIGHDMHTDYWRESYKEIFHDAIHMDIQVLHAALQKNNFDYIIIGQRELKHFGQDVIQDKLKSLSENELFEFVYGPGNGVRIFKVLPL